MTTLADLGVGELTDAFEAGRVPDGDFEAFAAANPDLLGPSRAFLLAYYSPETLDGEIARRQFVPPDRLPRSTGRPAAAGTAPLPPRSALGSGARPG